MTERRADLEIDPTDTVELFRLQVISVFEVRAR